MNTLALPPAEAIAFLSSLCGCFVQIGVGYAFCRLVALLLPSPAMRFFLWLFFLVASTADWLLSMARPFLTGTTPPPPASHAGSDVHSVLFPPHLAGVVSLGLGAAALVYCAALFSTFLLGAWKRVQLRRALRFRVRPSPSTQQVFRELAQGSRCELWLLPGLPSPASRGWANAAIYLPADDAVAPANLRDVLLHELSHVRRRDGLWDAVGRACRWIVLFHPCAYKAYSFLRLERELACDLIVIRRDPAQRDRYADTLLRFAWRSSLTQNPDRIGIGFTSKAAVLNARIRSILEGERTRSGWSLSARALLAAGACSLFALAAPALWVEFQMPFAGMRPVASASAKTPAIKHANRRSNRVLDRTDTVTAVSSTPTPPAAPLWTAIAEPSVVYRSQREEIPAPETTAQEKQPEIPSASDPAGGPKLGTPSVPAATSVVVGALTTLGRIALAHGRDHDRD